MGEYFNWVNVDKKEYISPYDFDYGNKRCESCGRGNALLNALKTLLDSDWKGDHIVFLGDQCYSRENLIPVIFEPINRIINELGYINVFAFDAVLEGFKDISGQFKGTEVIVKDEIEYYMDRIGESGEGALTNYYGIDKNDPYKGLFIKDSRDYRYTVNYTKKIAYSSETTKVVDMDGRMCDFADPLPFMMYWGQSEEPGEWLGDVIGVDDLLPEGIILLDTVNIDL